MNSILSVIYNLIFVVEGGTDITSFFWAVGEPNRLGGKNENRIQLRMAAGYKWNDAPGSDVIETGKSGWSVNKFICQGKLLRFKAWYLFLMPHPAVTQTHYINVWN